MAAEPEILPMDEPFVSLDKAAAGQVRELTLDLWRETRPAVLMVTHDPTEAVSIADRVLVLSGRPASIAADLPLHRPQSRRDRKWIQGDSEQPLQIAENGVISGGTDAL